MAAYKLRTPGTFADAATKYRDQFTADGAAAIIGARSASRINQACDPEQVNYTPLGVRQALELDVAFYQRHGYAPTFDVYRRQLAERTTGSAPAISPMVAISQMTAEHSDVIRALCDSVSEQGPGGKVVTSVEALNAVREIDALIALAEGVRASLCQTAGISPTARPQAIIAELDRRTGPEAGSPPATDSAA